MAGAASLTRDEAQRIAADIAKLPMLLKITSYHRTPRIMSNWSDEETDEPLIADHRNFYKVEKWSRDGERVTELLFAGSSLDKAKRVFDRWAKHRPRIRMTIRQRTRVLQ